MHLIEYVETEMRTFDEAPLGPVDSAVLSQLAMVRVECLAPTRPIAPHELLRAERFEELLGVGLEPDLLKRLLFAVCASPGSGASPSTARSPSSTRSARPSLPQ